jgi:mono/diheme cytochrome c family protein
LATTLRPQPRDFTHGLFRYRSTPTGQLPSDEDLLRTVTVGLPGSTMPAWEPFLTEAERRAVVAYLKHFSPRFATDTSQDVLPLPSPPTATAERVAQGEKLYRESGCGSCHGETGKGDGRAGKDLKTSEGDLIVPRDLTNKWSFRGGHLPQDVFQRLSTGMDGSPMASYRDAFSLTELWDLVFYILSLSPLERPQVQVLRDHGSPARSMAPLLTERE